MRPGGRLVVTSAAVQAECGVDDVPLVHRLNRGLRADLDARSAVVAGPIFPGGNDRAHDPDVVLGRLGAVVRATRDGDLELVRRLLGEVPCDPAPGRPPSCRRSPPAGLGPGTGRNDPARGARPHPWSLPRLRARGSPPRHQRRARCGSRSPVGSKGAAVPCRTSRPLRRSSVSDWSRTPRPRHGAAGRRSPSASAGWCRGSYFGVGLMPYPSYLPRSASLEAVPISLFPCRGRCLLPGGDLDCPLS